MMGGGTKLSSIDRVRNSADVLGLEIEVRRMDQSTRTAREAAAACGCEVAQIIKSLIFENADDQSLVLCLVSGIHQADIDYISKHYGIKLIRCDTRRVRRETGFAIGGVAPIGHLSPIAIYMDETLLNFEHVWAAAGRPDSVFRVEATALAEAIEATIIQVVDADENKDARKP